jgi:hypothetical protein
VPTTARAKSYLVYPVRPVLQRGAPRTKTQGHIYGIETRARLVDKSALARRTGFAACRFEDLGDAAPYRRAAGRIDIVTALHACDTATDDAIAFGLAKRHGAGACCQAGVMRSNAAALNLTKTHAGRGCGGTPATRAGQPDHQRAALPAAPGTNGLASP